MSNSNQPWNWPRAFATAVEGATVLGIIYCLTRCNAGGSW